MDAKEELELRTALFLSLQPSCSAAATAPSPAPPRVRPAAHAPASPHHTMPPRPLPGRQRAVRTWPPDGSGGRSAPSAGAPACLPAGVARPNGACHSQLPAPLSACLLQSADASHCAPAWQHSGAALLPMTHFTRRRVEVDDHCICASYRVAAGGCSSHAVRQQWERPGSTSSHRICAPSPPAGPCR